MFTNSINHLQKNIHSTFINRITIITLLISVLFTFNTLNFQSIGKGISIYSGLYQITVQSHIVEMLLLIVGISILLAWPFLLLTDTYSSLQSYYRPYLKGFVLAGDAMQDEKNNKDLLEQKKKTVLALSGIKKSDQYSLIAIFSILGGSLLMSSLDLLSMYLSIELQSFALYVLATLNKERLSATSAGLKYFLLGSLSSCFILLGAAIIYSYTGLTHFEAINSLMSVSNFETGSNLPGTAVT
jgi:NADH-ubiquinone oxidoreductase chain 2